MKIPRQSYTLEFKELAVKRVKDGQSYSAVAKELGINEQTLRNWSSAVARGALTGSRSLRFNSFKNEQVFGNRFRTRDEVRSVAFEYIEVFYNRKRQHSTLGYLSPEKFLHHWQ